MYSRECVQESVYRRVCTVECVYSRVCTVECVQDSVYRRVCVQESVYLEDGLEVEGESVPQGELPAGGSGDEPAALRGPLQGTGGKQQQQVSNQQCIITLTYIYNATLQVRELTAASGLNPSDC